MFALGDDYMKVEISDSLSLDRKDLQILEILAHNCRCTHAAIAEALHVSKDTIAYRVERLERSGVLSRYVLFVDGRRLGFTRHHLLIRFKSQRLNQTKILAALCAHPAAMWVNTFLGRYDLQVIVDAEDGAALNAIREDLFARCEHAVSDYSVLTHLCDLEFTQLNPVLDLETKFARRRDHSFSDVLAPRRFPVSMRFSRTSLDRLECEALRILADDPRIGVSELAAKMNCDRLTARRKVLALIERRLILSFGGVPNLFALGFVTYYLLVRLQQDVPLETMQKPFGELRNIFYAGRMIGDYDMIVYLNARNPEELENSITLFRRDLGSCVLHYDLLIQDRVHHWRQFTPYLYERTRPTRPRSR